MRARFERFVADKTRAAAGAALAQYVTEVDSRQDNALVVGNAWSMRLFDGPFYLSPPRSTLRPSCSLVFVRSADGNTGAADPGTLGGGETDKHLIYEGLSRAAADAVLAGAETVRGTDLILSVWHPEMVHLRTSLGLPRHPVQIVATIRGIALDEALLFNVPEVPVVLLTSSAGADHMKDAVRARPWVTLLRMETPEDLPDAFERLRSRGISRVSCVGGRTLASHLLAAHLVDDVYLTTAARAGGEPGTPLPMPGQSRVIVRKHGTGTDTGVVFEHLVPV
jgi:riboflavin biosynthesis pyrimidine reductase